jgi:tetratricopeptide (TPR) repeat protein
MISHFRKLIALPLALLLTLSLSSCEGLTYREAIDLYNEQKYSEASVLFSQLGDYEDSAELLTRCFYWETIQLMEQGNYAEALPRFIELGDYEDCAQRIIECRYQLAMVAFNDGDYAQAEQEFLDFADYRQTPEYLRQINWMKFYHYICENGSEGGGCFVFSTQQDARTVNVLVDSAAPDQITFIASWEKDMGYIFRDVLSIAITRESFDASFTAESTFTMDFDGKEIGSVQTAEGRFSITDCTADMELAPETFTKTVTDNQGKVTNSTDPADATMFQEMQKNYTAIMAVFPQVLVDSGLGITPADMGFANLN